MYKKSLTCLIICLILSGCGANYYRRGKISFLKKDYGRAIENLSKASEKNPEKEEIWQKLGVVYYKKGDLDRAFDALKQAELIKPDPKTSFYLALIYDRKNELEKAISSYQEFLLFKPQEEIEKKVKIRIKSLSEQIIEGEVQKALVEEEKISQVEIPSNNLTIASFKPLGLDPSLKVFSKGLTELLHQDLVRVKKLKVVERQKLEKLLEKIEFKESEYLDKFVVPRVGKLLGASQIVVGSIEYSEEEKLKIKASLVSTRTVDSSWEPEKILQAKLADLGYYDGEIDGKIGPKSKAAIKKFQKDQGLTPDGIYGPKTESAIEREYKEKEKKKGKWAIPLGQEIETRKEMIKTETKENFFKLEKELAFEIIESMGVEITPEEKEQIKKVPTRSLSSFLAYCRGLDHLDEGRYENAKKEFERALLDDPKFHQALDMYNLSLDLSEYKTPVENLLSLETTFETLEKEVIFDFLGERLNQTNDNISLIQDPARDNPYTPATKVETGTVIITGELDKR